MPVKLKNISELIGRVKTEVPLHSKPSKVQNIKITDISPNPNQPRRTFERAALEELRDSIARYGILQPLTVRMTDRQKYELVAGERRLRAAAEAGLAEVPCIVVEISGETSSLLALIENIQREDLNFFEEASGIRRLIQSFGLTQEEVAAKIGKTQSTVANKLRLLRFGERERELIISSGLTERHARAALRIEEAEDRLKILSQAAEKSLNVSDTEKLVDVFLEKREKPHPLRKHIFKDIQIFVNSINHAVGVMRQAGINALAEKNESDEFVEYYIKIPKA